MNRIEWKSKRGFWFCPKCGSTNIWWLGGLPYLAPYMECRECGHRGIFIVGERELADKIREEYLDRKRRESEG